MRLYKIEGYWWIGMPHGSKILLLRCCGRVGDCIRP